MEESEYFLKNCTVKTQQNSPTGEIVEYEKEKYYKISYYDFMPPFLMNIVSNTDLWMFLSSNGALTAGRRNPDNSLFPYYTDDKIYDSKDITGSKTVAIINKEDNQFLWEPFSSRYKGIYDLKRNIYKNITSNHIIFEEINTDLNIVFKYAWLNCEKFGFVKRSQLINNDSGTVKIRLIDGIQNILPADVNQRMQMEYSTLIDGYRKNELHNESSLAAYRLSSIPTDKAEPNESLRANTVWSTGIDRKNILLSNNQINLFYQGKSVKQEPDIKATRGAYFVESTFNLSSNDEKKWYIIADVNKDQSDFIELSHYITSTENIAQVIENEIQKDKEDLEIKISQADGFQLTSDLNNQFRHASNTLFNILRGGIFDNGFIINKSEFKLFIKNANKRIAELYKDNIEALPDQINIKELIDKIASHDPDLERLCYEYLPLTFSRRHADPSRPWNQFSIDIKDEQGNKKLGYQGNWRDIFQNWEALAMSFPEYIEKMIVNFIDASTADGYNPYRITSDGFDWEIIDPVDEWSYIGYWGDHQIIYLLKLMELSEKYHPGKLHALLTKNIFTFANVPYRLKSYKDIIEDPHNTIEFDTKLDEIIRSRVEQIGNDGKFILKDDGEIVHVNLLEKLLVPLLVKLSNFIPEAGIWMNTQRPEWNDANNALVGYGASMVTVYYIRRFVEFLSHFFEDTNIDSFEVSEEIFDFFSGTSQGFENFKESLQGPISDNDRKKILDHLGQKGSDYRIKIYSEGFSGTRVALKTGQLQKFLNLAKQFIDHSIQANKREDDLYHAYNLIKFSGKNGIKIRNLYEMLEGQVAILSSGYLTTEDSLILINALRKSALYREDQSSYILYPNRDLPGFIEKNTIPKNLIENTGLHDKNVALKGNSIFKKDIQGKWHFKSDFRNARILKEKLIELNRQSSILAQDEIDLILDIYETVFDHQAFTGRSGTFYKYEGLGCIYWHMVSKLLLSVQETFYETDKFTNNGSVIAKLKTFYYDIRGGIGSHKNPALYGAFPTDAYSHTPEHSGAQQPGMTGQVKEDIISRFGEFGIIVEKGKIRFNPRLLKKEEFLNNTQTFYYYDLKNKKQSMLLNENMLAFTVCQVPVVYIYSNEQKVIVTKSDGTEIDMDGLEIDASISQSIFNRENVIRKIRVVLDEKIIK